MGCAEMRPSDPWRRRPSSYPSLDDIDVVMQHVFGKISQLKPVIEAYVHEAVSLGKAGAKIERNTTAEFPVAAEFRSG
jgi:uncharacterized protein YdeI (YjbR/CyaY-like superfamily)